METISLDIANTNQGPLNPETVFPGFFSLPLILSETLHLQMINHAQDTFPNECVGFFYGKDEPQARILSHVKSIKNAKSGDQRRRFEVSPRDYMQAELFAENNQLSLIGIYHSHPNHPGIPSIYDLAKAVPYFSYIILSIQDGKWSHTRSWRLIDQHLFQEEQIELRPINK